MWVKKSHGQENTPQRIPFIWGHFQVVPTHHNPPKSMQDSFILWVTSTLNTIGQMCPKPLAGDKKSFQLGLD